MVDASVSAVEDGATPRQALVMAASALALTAACPDKSRKWAGTTCADPASLARDAIPGLFDGLDGLQAAVSSAKRGAGDILAAALATSRDGDMLQSVQRQVVRKAGRKTGGEFYTPPWLARMTLSTLRWPARKTFLDPACGTGVFLLEAARRTADALVGGGCPEDRAAAMAALSVAGIDIDPVAVLCARANMLRFLAGRGAKASLSGLDIRQGDALFAGDLPKADILVGNPPWVRWSALDKEYREKVKTLAVDSGMYQGNGRHGGREMDLSAVMVLATAACLPDDGEAALILPLSLFRNPSCAGFRSFFLPGRDRFLVPSEVLDLSGIKPFPDASVKSCVVRFSVSRQPAAYPVPLTFVRHRPGSAATIPACADLEENRSRFVRVPGEACPISKDDPASPWAMTKPGGMADFGRMCGKDRILAGRKGITTDLNGAYFFRGEPVCPGEILAENMADAGRKPVPVVKAAIETDMVFPLLKGAGNIGPCRFLPDENLFCLVPNRGITATDYARAGDGIRRLPMTRAWFERFRAFLPGRSTYRLHQAPAGAPDHVVYDVGPYTFSPWKVVWPEQATVFRAAVAGTGMVPGHGSRPFVPDHKVYFVPFDDKEPAMFLCGLLNSGFVREFVASHMVGLQIGDIFKYMSMPEFDRTSQDHLALVRLVEEAHGTGNPDKAISAADRIMKTFSSDAQTNS